MRQILLECAGGDSVRQSGKRLHGGSRWMAVTALLTLGWLPVVHAGNPVVIRIKTKPSAPIAAGSSGFNTPQPRNGVEYYDPKFVAAATPLRGGWVRYPAGTASLAFDWTTGHTNTAWMQYCSVTRHLRGADDRVVSSAQTQEWQTTKSDGLPHKVNSIAPRNSLIGGIPPAVTGQSANVLTVSQQLTQAKGGVAFSDFATFASTLGASTIICFNSYTDNNPGSATQMALAAQSYGLNVVKWELSNEAYVYPLIYQTAADYAGSSNSYFNDIRTGASAATVGLFLAGWYPGTSGCPAAPAPPQPCFPNWDSGLSSFTPPPGIGMRRRIIFIRSSRFNPPRTRFWIATIS